MKTRIKVKQQRNGIKLYYPQIKGLIFWGLPSEYDVCYYTLAEAREFLDNYTGLEITKTYFLEYP